MRTATTRWTIAGIALLVLWAPPAWGQRGVKNQIAQQHRQAMARYDDFEFEEAKQLLEEVVALAGRSQLDEDPLLARVYLDLGVVYFSGLGDVRTAVVYLDKAVAINPQIELDPAYSSNDLEALLKQAKSRIGKEPADQTGADEYPNEFPNEFSEIEPEKDCAQVNGIEHNVIDRAEKGKSREIVAYVSDRLQATRIDLHYRALGTGDSSPEYTAVEMTNPAGDCRFAATIPGQAVRGNVIHYYIAAYDESDQALFERGSQGAPNLMTVTTGAGAAATGNGPDDNPLDSPVRSGQNPRVPPSRFLFAALATGSGGAYVSGKTEQTGSDVNCCVAPAPVHVVAEVGIYLAPQITVSGIFRLGFPLGANLDNHAVAAPAWLMRLQYALAETGDGLRIAALAGGGVIRQTVKIEAESLGMDTDTTAIGPILLGAGVGYVQPVTDLLQIVAEANTMVGVPVVAAIGTTRPSFGIQLDVSLGLQLNF